MISCRPPCVLAVARACAPRRRPDADAQKVSYSGFGLEPTATTLTDLGPVGAVVRDATATSRAEGLTSPPATKGVHAAGARAPSVIPDVRAGPPAPGLYRLYCVTSFLPQNLPKNASNDTSTEDIKVLLSVITSTDIGEHALLAEKFKTAANPVGKIIILAEKASLVEVECKGQRKKNPQRRGEAAPTEEGEAGVYE
ncbi:hypothetical protein EVAR_22082_1 [Eumeta japonica]|uniref:Uncharacterized protein n=1 Tax=Eumeta variegata TaxID=151549 RepID=A0A4C1UTB2_EUMVA|nr:hypothetical protein EVAR_22082_1 [Eumeta japonica]